MKLLLAREEGAMSQGSGQNLTPSTATSYFLTVVLPLHKDRLNVRIQRDMRTMARCLDLIALGLPEKSADILAQRLEALELMVTDQSWSRAQHLEQMNERKLRMWKGKGQGKEQDRKGKSYGGRGKGKKGQKWSNWPAPPAEAEKHPPKWEKRTHLMSLQIWRIWLMRVEEDSEEVANESPFPGDEGVNECHGDGLDNGGRENDEAREIFWGPWWTAAETGQYGSLGKFFRLWCLPTQPHPGAVPPHSRRGDILPMPIWNIGISEDVTPWLQAAFSVLNFNYCTGWTRPVCVPIEGGLTGNQIEALVTAARIS